MRSWLKTLGFAMAVGVMLSASISQAQGELTGTKTLSAKFADGSAVVLGTIDFTPTEQGAANFKLNLRTEQLSDHFLSMREFKCIEASQELTCYVPYPYPHPATISPNDFVWLEHSLLFFFKAPRDFGAKLWNGLYFEFQQSGTMLIGTPKAVDLNLIAAPPADPLQAPFEKELRHEIPADSRWLRSLVLE
ncbi:hypothetical protein SAMN02745130_02568 [Thiothrix eikelboomii]|uniref:Uncharacterized protein n=1 Tax=Thiothrix eikelboomii TaxID=92487 RepID=A0A1T4X604_9GAMM|nr:hypothetical protein [Thiothrix eikelboomii]SKA85022.1 hypothetical protein SAMN02745130_02568 [Thiothrix eikelboomii]